MSDASVLRMQSDEAEPTARNYTFRQVLQEQNRTYSLALCPSMLSEVSHRLVP